MQRDLSLPNDPQSKESARIMVVDDTPENLTLLKDMLGKQGFDIYALPSGALALRAALRIQPDLVLLDINMPEMDGYAVCERFKSDSRLADVPIIFLSALTGTAEKVQGFRCGGVDFITKPFQLEEVLARVTAHLKIRDLQRQLAYQNQNLQKLVSQQVEQLATAHIQSRQRMDEIAHLNRNITSSIYSAGISHDLRQPLAAILANAEAAELLLERNPPDLAVVKDILADIRRDDQRASDIVSSMRKLLNKHEASVQDLDVNGVVHDVLDFLAGEARLRAVRITASVWPSALVVRGDRVHLQQVITNLVINGMEAMAGIAAEQRHLEVSTALVAPDGVQVTVADSGTGFGSSLGLAFESFFTTKTTGMGMGLSIAASLIEQHGGTITAANRKAGGAVVAFQIPLAAKVLT